MTYQNQNTSKGKRPDLSLRVKDAEGNVMDGVYIGVYENESKAGKKYLSFPKDTGSRLAKQGIDVDQVISNLFTFGGTFFRNDPNFQGGAKKPASDTSFGFGNNAAPTTNNGWGN